MSNDLSTTFQKISQKKSFRTREHYLKDDLYQRQIGFDCLHCHQTVSSMFALSAVNNRNHCPYCLWSKHVDHFQAGDRLSACKMPMQPLGLTFKQQRNRYGSSLGELMLIHQCKGCQAISINRIAADDDNQQLMVLLGTSLTLDVELKIRLNESGIHPVTGFQRELVIQRLFGRRERE